MVGVLVADIYFGRAEVVVGVLLVNHYSFNAVRFKLMFDKFGLSDAIGGIY